MASGRNTFIFLSITACLKFLLEAENALPKLYLRVIGFLKNWKIDGFSLESMVETVFLDEVV